MPKTHAIKILPKYFNAVENGTKKFEIRKNDRGYKVGDILILQEYDYLKYTGRSITKSITYILYGKGIEEGYAILSLGHIPTGAKCENCQINEPIFESDICQYCYAQELGFAHDVLTGKYQHKDF